MGRQCEICGETRLPGWADCPACGHPYAGGEEPDDEVIDDDEPDDD